MKPKLLLLDEPCDKAKEILKEVFSLHYDDMFDYDAIWTGLTSIITDVSVFCPCTGIDHIKSSNVIYLDDDWKRGEGRSVTSTAEHTWSLILQLAKMKRIQLKHKKLGIIGNGRIGQQVHNFAKSFELTSYCFDKNYNYTLYDVLPESDIITLHVPLNESTRGMIGKREFELMKDGALLVNTSRAEIVDTFELVQALESGKLGGYANDFDVFPNHPNVIATNHIGGNCIEAREATDIYIAKKAIEYWRSMNS